MKWVGSVSIAGNSTRTARLISIDRNTLIGAPDFSDYNRGSKGEDDPDEVDDTNDNTELEDILEESMDIQTDISTGRALSGCERMSGTKVEQAEQGRNISMRSSRRDAGRAVSTNPAKRTGHIAAQSAQRNISDFRPPQTLPGWNEYSPDTLIFKDEPLPEFIRERNNYQEGANVAMGWESHPPPHAPNIDMVAHYHDQNMLSTGHFATTSMHDPYVQSSPGQQLTHNHQFHSAHGFFNSSPNYDQRMARPRNPSAFDTYMHEVNPTSGMMHGNYYQI